MLTGSLASSLHDLPRSTRDIDLVIDPSRVQLETVFAELLEQTCRADLEATPEGLTRRGQFNVIDHDSGWKIEIIVRERKRCQAPFRVSGWESFDWDGEWSEEPMSGSEGGSDENPAGSTQP